VYESRSTGPAPEWTAEEKALIAEVQAARPPEATFRLAPWAEVIDPATLHAAVLADIRNGPSRGTEMREALLIRLRLYAIVLRGRK
jgi:hypothetical protein